MPASRPRIAAIGRAVIWLTHNSDVCRFSDLLQSCRIDTATVLPSEHASEFARARALAPVKIASCQKL